MKSNSPLDRAVRPLLAGLAFGLALAGCQPQMGADYPERDTLSHAPRLSPALPSSWAPAASETLQLSPLLEPAPAADAAPAASPVRMWTDWSADRALPGIVRSREAHERRLPIVRDLFAQAGVPFPPAQLAFVAYKQEKELEVWASAEEGGEAKRVATYGICAASGVLGPKRYEGDRQVPEGFYALQYGWAESNYHLEMKVSYPGLVDKVLGPKDRPLGGEIMIHGDCASIGCLAMGDERVEELWVMMRAKGDAQVKVHIYPARDMAALLRDPAYAPHHAFWQNLKDGRDLFERERRIPKVRADWHGVYMFE